MGEILEKNERHIRESVNPSGIFYGGVYLCGHPDMNESVPVIVTVTDTDLIFFQGELRLGAIPKKAIRKIAVEDKTTVESKVTVGRFLALGVFSLAFKKKKANEAAFVVVDWTDEKGLENSTILKFEEKGSLTEANTLRNSIVKLL